jgi:hypothetical protein
VTECTSGLVYWNEPGALNEAFSDIIAVAAEFELNEPLASNCRRAPGQAGCPDWWIGEDVWRGGGPLGIRSLADPAAGGQPSHYSARYKGSALGFAWNFVIPLMQLVVFWILFGVFFGVRPRTTQLGHSVTRGFLPVAVKPAPHEGHVMWCRFGSTGADGSGASASGGATPSVPTPIGAGSTRPVGKVPSSTRRPASITSAQSTKLHHASWNSSGRSGFLLNMVRSIAGPWAAREPRPPRQTSSNMGSSMGA